MPTRRESIKPREGVVVGGLNEPAAHAGTPLALSVTVSAEPLVTAVEMVDVALPPWTADTLAGFAPIEKSLGAAVTVSVTVVLCVALGAVPVTVTEYGPEVGRAAWRERREVSVAAVSLEGKKEAGA